METQEQFVLFENFCVKLTIKTLEQSRVFIVNSEQV